MSSSSIIPQHIAIIMDGNGRWANQRGLPRVAGHKKGADVVQTTVDACIKQGVKYLTLYAFSSENWKRPSDEISALMNLLNRFLKLNAKQMQKRNVRLKTIGRTSMLPEKCQKTLKQSIEKTKDNTTLTLTLALSYGGREELVDATQAIAKKVAAGEIKADQINNAILADHLYTADLPDPEMMIRTSGEIRLSNFLLWQLSYAEIILIDKYWPEFNETDLAAAIQTFQQRNRRFGALS